MCLAQGGRGISIRGRVRVTPEKLRKAGSLVVPSKGTTKARRLISGGAPVACLSNLDSRVQLPRPAGLEQDSQIPSRTAALPSTLAVAPLVI